MADDADVIVVGGGLAGLVAATEIADAGKRVIVVDQEGEQSLGGQAFWSFGGLFLVDSPEQRRLGIKDSFELALQDWMGTAGFDRDEDYWPRRWAEAYVAFAAGEKRDWLRAMGHRIFPVVGWAERGGYDAMGHGNSVPRFHVTWGTGPGIVEPFERRAREAQKSGRLTFKFRHRVDALSITNGAVDGVSGAILEPDRCRARPELVRARIVGDFSAARASRDRRLRRHRRQSRSGAAELAEAARRAAEIHDLRRARTCRRPHDRHHRGRRRAADQPRPDVALRRGHPELVADLAAPRHPHPARTIVDVVRRHRQAAAGAAVSRLRHARATALHHVDRLRLFLVRPDAKHHQEGIRAFRLRAKPRPHRKKLAHDHQARHQQGRAGAGGGVQEERRRFHRARQSGRPRRAR